MYIVCDSIVSRRKYMIWDDCNPICHSPIVARNNLNYFHIDFHVTFLFLEITPPI